MIAIDACHLLLGRPWQFDRDVTHNGEANTYSFTFEGVKIMLVPNKDREQSEQVREENKGCISLLTLA